MYILGTGQLALMLAGHCKRVVGIDISQKMTDFAKDKAAQSHTRNVKFICGDVVDVAKSYRTNEFDYATITMALHEMPKEYRAPVLAALGRIARRIIVVDFPASMPLNFAGLRNRLIEFLTVFLDWSTEHFFNFLEFREEGGVEHILNVCNITNDSRARAILEIDKVRYIDGGSIGLYYISTGTGANHFRSELEVDSDTSASDAESQPQSSSAATGPSPPPNPPPRLMARL